MSIRVVLLAISLSNLVQEEHEESPQSTSDRVHHEVGDHIDGSGDGGQGERHLLLMLNMNLMVMVVAVRVTGTPPRRGREAREVGAGAKTPSMCCSAIPDQTRFQMHSRWIPTFT